jgi:hypothetical protein
MRTGPGRRSARRFRATSPLRLQPAPFAGLAPPLPALKSAGKTNSATLANDHRLARWVIDSTRKYSANTDPRAYVEEPLLRDCYDRAGLIGFVRDEVLAWKDKDTLRVV